MRQKADLPAHAAGAKLPAEPALLRLEDIGPGGAYRTLDDLGRLRAVLEFLAGQQVPYQVAVISRWKTSEPDGEWYEKGIDDPSPDFYTLQFIDLLMRAVQQGAVLGMHGYTHQYGEKPRSDQNEQTGDGFEFAIEGAPETYSAAYAAGRITRSIDAFEKAGLQPAFWETPHYVNSPDQEAVFPSFMGVIYQPPQSRPEIKQLFCSEENYTFGSTSNGAVYIPTPLGYIHENHTVEHVLAELADYQGLVSLFYHPFLEFPHLEQVKDGSANPMMYGGLPVYRYKKGARSNLQKLIPAVRELGYRWTSLADLVAFFPAHRISLPKNASTHRLMVGHVRAGSQADLVIQTENQLAVVTGCYKWPRNRKEDPPRIWLQQSFPPEEQLLLLDLNGDGKQDLLAYHKQTGQVRAFYSTGRQFEPAIDYGTLPPHLDSLQAIFANGDQLADLVLTAKRQVRIAVNTGNGFKVTPPGFYLPTDSQLLVGDIDGDRYDELFFYSQADRKLRIYCNPGTHGYWRTLGVELPVAAENALLLACNSAGNRKTRLIVYTPLDGLWEVLQAHRDLSGFYRVKRTFGPWGRHQQHLICADFDGNGKEDIAVYSQAQHTLDIALGYGD